MSSSPSLPYLTYNSRFMLLEISVTSHSLGLSKVEVTEWGGSRSRSRSRAGEFFVWQSTGSLSCSEDAEKHLCKKCICLSQTGIESERETIKIPHFTWTLQTLSLICTLWTEATTKAAVNQCKQDLPATDGTDKRICPAECTKHIIFNISKVVTK